MKVLLVDKTKNGRLTKLDQMLTKVVQIKTGNAKREANKIYHYEYINIIILV